MESRHPTIILTSLFSLAMVTQSLADSVVRTLPWNTGHSSEAEIVSDTPVDILGIKLGMTIDDVNDVISKNEKLKSKGFIHHMGWGNTPRYTYVRKVDDAEVVIHFSDLRDHHLIIEIKTPGTASDKIEVMFLPDGTNKIVYGIRRTLDASGTSFDATEAWDQTFKKYGKIDRTNDGQAKSSKSYANYNWNASGKSIPENTCTWPTYFAGDEYIFNDYDLDDFKGFSESLNRGCATILSVLQKRDVKTNTVKHFETILFDNELYTKSLERNLQEIDQALGGVKNGIDKQKSLIGKGEVDL